MRNSTRLSILFFTTYTLMFLQVNVSAQIIDTTKNDTLKSISSAYHLGKKKETKSTKKAEKSLATSYLRAEAAARESDKSAAAARKAFEDFEKRNQSKIKLEYHAIKKNYVISYLADDVNSFASFLGGIKVGDVITHIDGKQLTNFSQKEVSKLLGQKKMILKYKRGKTEGTFFFENK